MKFADRTARDATTGTWKECDVIKFDESEGHHHHHHQSLNREGRWGTTDDFATHYPLGLAELQACPFPDVVFPPLPLSALSSSPFHCALAPRREAGDV